MRTKLLLSFLIAMLFSSFGMSEGHAARYDLSPNSGSFKLDCMSTIDVVLDTQGVASNAADMFLNYNPSEIEFIDQDPQKDDVQVKTGGVYSVYAANIVTPGQVRVTAFNLVGSFNGKGVFATLVFNVKPGVTSTSLRFEFTLGETTDSNVANLAAQDVLTAVGNGSYSFTNEPCSPDTQPPQVSQIVPPNGSRDVPLASNMSFVISDNQSGVDLEYLQIQVGVEVYDRTSPSLRTTGTPMSYAVELDPVIDFPENDSVSILIRAQDLDGNVMTPRFISYNEPIPPPPEPVCGNKIVEEGEECEPPGTFSCNTECESDLLACLEVDPAVLEEMALQAAESGELTPEQIASVTSMKELTQKIQEAAEARAEQIAQEEAPQNGSLIGGFSVTKTVEILTRSTQTIVETLGCSGNCVKVLFGESNQRWYVPVGILTILFLILLVYLWKKLQNMRKEKEEMELSIKSRKKRSGE